MKHFQSGGSKLSTGTAWKKICPEHIYGHMICKTGILLPSCLLCGKSAHQERTVAHVCLRWAILCSEPSDILFPLKLYYGYVTLGSELNLAERRAGKYVLPALDAQFHTLIYLDSPDKVLTQLKMSFGQFTLKPHKGIII